MPKTSARAKMAEKISVCCKLLTLFARRLTDNVANGSVILQILGTSRLLFPAFQPHVMRRNFGAMAYRKNYMCMAEKLQGIL